MQCNPVDFFLRQPIHRPLIHRHRPQRLIKLNRRLVPIQHRPLHPPAPAFLRYLDHVNQQRFSKAFPAMLDIDKQILKINPRLAHKRRKIMKEKRKSHRLVIGKRQQHFRIRPRSKQRLAQSGFRRNHRVRKLLVLRKLPNERKNQRNIVCRRGTYLKSTHAHSFSRTELRSVLPQAIPFPMPPQSAPSARAFHPAAKTPPSLCSPRSASNPQTTTPSAPTPANTPRSNSSRKSSDRPY